MQSGKICFVFTNNESIKLYKDFIDSLQKQNNEITCLIPEKLEAAADCCCKKYVIQELTQDIPYYLEYNFSSEQEYLSYLIYKALEKIYPSENFDVILFASDITDSGISIQANMTLGKFEKAALVISSDNTGNFDKYNLLARYRLVYLQELAQNNADSTISSNSSSQDFQDLFNFKPKPFIRFNSLNPMPKVSVIIPFYNAHKYLEETLISIEKNAYPNKEIIIVNDGSTEKASINLLEQLEESDKYKILHKSNGGLPAARNFGVKYATGNYLFFLDSDDIIDQDYLEKGINCLINNSNTSYVITYCNNITEDGKNLIYSCPIYPNYPPLVAFGGSYSAIFRKEIFEKFEYDEKLKTYEDWELYSNLSKNRCFGVVIPEFLFDYRRRPDSLLSTFKGNEELQTRQYIWEKHREFYEQYDINLLGESRIPAFDILEILNKLNSSNKMQNFIKKNQGKKVCFYGAGYLAQELIGRYDLSDLNLAGFIDTSIDKIGQKLGNYQIYSIDDIGKIQPDIIALTVVQKQVVLPYLEHIKLAEKLNYDLVYDLFD